MTGKFDSMKIESVKAFVAGEHLANAKPGSPAGTRDKLDEYVQACSTDPVACADGMKNGVALRNEMKGSSARSLAAKVGDVTPIGPAEKASLDALGAMDAKSKSNNPQQSRIKALFKP